MIEAIFENLFKPIDDDEKLQRLETALNELPDDGIDELMETAAFDDFVHELDSASDYRAAILDAVRGNDTRIDAVMNEVGWLLFLPYAPEPEE